MSLVRTAKGRPAATEDANGVSGQGASTSDTNELGRRRSMRLRGAPSTDSSVVSPHAHSLRKVTDWQIICSPTAP